jgi:hypothetical protein
MTSMLPYQASGRLKLYLVDVLQGPASLAQMTKDKG